VARLLVFVGARINYEFVCERAVLRGWYVGDSELSAIETDGRGSRRRLNPFHLPTLCDPTSNLTIK
jgi:hypothetical protein